MFLKTTINKELIWKYIAHYNIKDACPIENQMI